MKVLVAMALAFAAVFIALAIASSYSDIPRQFGGKVCVKILNELKCEPIADQN